MTISVRHPDRPYLRSRPWRHAVCAALGVAGLCGAAIVTPAAAKPALVAASAFAARAWFYCMSIILGSLPLVVLGAAGAGLASRLGSARARGTGALALALCLPGCDCTLAGAGGLLARLPPARAGVVLVLGALCNPMALGVTYAVLGPRACLGRLLCGGACAALTAFAWRSAACVPAAVCRHNANLWEDCALHMQQALLSVGASAVVAGIILAEGGHGVRLESAGAALLAGALLSPCSASDPLLARAFFHSLPHQMVFIVAAQCLDVRRYAMLRSCFGGRLALRAFAMAAASCLLAYAV